MRPVSSSKFTALSGKHLAVDKANTQVVIAVSVATALLVFALFASLSLAEKIKYQNKVIGKRNDAVAQLEENVKATESLVNSYVVFDSAVGSVIGSADKNSKIVLDSLPSKYDFPALATSLELIIRGAGLTVDSITGSDLEATALQSSIEPEIVPIPFQIDAAGNYGAVQQLIKDLERSIRPFKINTLQISGSDNSLKVSIAAETYYMPARELGIVEEVVKSDSGARAARSTATEDK